MIAQVIINSNAKDLDRIFEYSVPEEIQEQIKIGSRILVPFGKMKKLEEAFVINFVESSTYKTKNIASVQKGDFLNAKKVQLAKWMAKRYFCNLSDAIKLMLPPGTATKNFGNRMKEKIIHFVYLKKEVDEKIKSEKQEKILNFLKENGEIAITDLEVLTETSRAIIKTLEKNGYVEIKEKQIDRNPFIHKVVKQTNKLKFTEEQQNAYNQIEEAIEDQMHSEFLIFGVTGSRKNRDLFANHSKSVRNGKR